jgi:catechol 2,3-dioxygenase-like lactoylglutathione lyase family enzyme
LSDCNPTEILKPFLRLNFATLWVRDQESSRRFFVDKLGFQPIVDAEIPGRDRWVVVAPCPPHWLHEAAGGGLPGIALVVPIEGSEESQRIGRNNGLSFLTDNARAVFAE